jgi:hypothetical protein
MPATRSAEPGAEPDSGPGTGIEMRACVLREPGRPVVVERVHLDPPRSGEVLVSVAAAGVCHTDRPAVLPRATRSCAAIAPSMR